MKLKELGELLDILRAKGVTEWKGFVDEFGQNMEVKLGSFAAVPEVTSTGQADEVKKAFQKMMTPQPRGRDGLTAEDQEDLYGQVVDEMEVIPKTEG